LLITGGELVTPEGRLAAALRATDATIQQIGTTLEPESGEEVIDATGLLVLPGIIDCHTHFALDTGKMQTVDDFEAGSGSAAAGGVTTYINIASQQRGQGLLDAFQQERTRASTHTSVDFALHLSLGTPGRNWDEELEALADLGVTSIKVYTTYRDTDSFTRDWDWYGLMRVSGRHGIVVLVHAENDDMLTGCAAELIAAGKIALRYHAASRPEIAETYAVAGGLALCRATGSPLYFVHLSSPDSVELVARAREEGLPVYAEITAHHISLDDAVYQTPDATRYMMSPPLRPRPRMERLRALVAEGMVDAIGSDHAAYGLHQRGGDVDFRRTSPGIPGVETLWPVVYTTLVSSGMMTLERALRLVTAGPAEIFGLDAKGALRVGADADIVLFDPRPTRPLDETTLHSRAGYSPWQGREIHGQVVRTISRGRTVYHQADHRLQPDFSHGTYVPRKRWRGRSCQA
jgi:dihydropyrimidinase